MVVPFPLAKVLDHDWMHVLETIRATRLNRASHFFFNHNKCSDSFPVGGLSDSVWFHSFLLSFTLKPSDRFFIPAVHPDVR